MQVPEKSRSVRSMKALEKLLDKIDGGDTSKPDWIQLEGAADLSRLALADRTSILERLHGAVLRGFKANDIRLHGKLKLLDYWMSVARCGFHDFAEDQWMKCYDSPFVENYEYVSAYMEGGLDALDPYMVYSSVLGTWEYSVEDFLNTELCKDVKTIVEPLAGTAEFCYAGHFRYPDLSYCMFDLDEEAKEHVEEKRWLEQTRRSFQIGNALEESTWKNVADFAQGKSLSYIGKQSQNFFDVQGLMKILEWGTRHTDHLMLEVSEPYLLDEEPSIDELTRPEQKAAGFRVALDDVESKPANPLTNALDFHLIAWDKQDRREFFGYCDWIGWQAPTLTALGRLMDLEVRYFHHDLTEFVSVDDHTDTSDCRDNNTFMLFSRK